MKRYIVYLAMVVSALTACSKRSVVSSPNGELSVYFALDKAGRPTYRVERNGKEVICPSAMGLCAVNAQGDTLSDKGWTIQSTESATVDTTWETVWGEERFIRDSHNELTIHLSPLNSKLSTLNLSITFRVFDDGFAFRYVLLGQGEQWTILDEHTNYVFAQEPEIWSIPWRTEYYEALFAKAPLHEKDTMASPVTLEMADGSYAFLHEAAVTDYPCQNLYNYQLAISNYQLANSNYQLSTYLTPWMKEGHELADKAYITTPFATPWRFMVLVNTLPELMASRVMLNLNEPCKIEDTSWIHPMKFIGIWWGMHKRVWTWRQGPQHGATTEHMQQYLDFAAQHGIGGVLAEGWNTGWEGFEGVNDEHFSFVTPYEDYDIERLSRYAQEQGVEIVCHHETSGRANEYEANLDTAYQYMQAHGMHAVKTGYVAPIITTVDGQQLNRSQSGVRHYRKVIETAARYHVMIDNHEPVMPSGLQRTWPNLMTQEGIRGQEWNAWSSDGGSPCSHVCTLPFTRMLAGPADYTPGVFDFANPVIPGTRVHATLANQLALFVVLYSPLQMACDQIESYAQHLDAFRFVEQVPCDWQQSRLLDGKIGEYVVMARQDRKSEDWYVGAVTACEPRDIALDLSFLTEGEWEAQIYRDGDDADWQTAPYAMVIDTVSLAAPFSPMHLHLASGGGCAIRFVKR